jgi:hypothetical protein
MQSLNRPSVITKWQNIRSLYIFPKVCARLRLSKIWGTDTWAFPPHQNLRGCIPMSSPVDMPQVAAYFVVMNQHGQLIVGKIEAATIYALVLKTLQ